MCVGNFHRLGKALRETAIREHLSAYACDMLVRLSLRLESGIRLDEISHTHPAVGSSS